MAAKLNGLEWIALDLLRTALGDSIEILAQDSYLPGSPDYVIESLGLVIQADGDWWHDKQGQMSMAGIRKVAGGDRPGGMFWINKAAENRARDKASSSALRKKGYKVIRLKENRLRSSRGLEYVSRAIALAIRA